MRLFVVVIAATAALLSGCGADTPTSPEMAFGVTLRPATVLAGTNSEGVVTLANRTAHAVEIHLSSSDAVASVPSTVTVPAQTSSTVFHVTTRVVAADSVATISATVGAIVQHVPLQVLAPVPRPATLDALVLDAAVVQGGRNAHGTVRLTAAAPAGGLTLHLRSSNSTAVVPDAIVVPGGAGTSSFNVAAQPVFLDTELEITAWYSDEVRTVRLVVTQ
jgi:hypothetical protein